MRRSIVFLAALLFIWPVIAEAKAEICSKDSRVIEACYEVHGRIRINADMRPYLHPSGTKRLLGIVEKSGVVDAGYYWPPEIGKMLDYNVDITGDFRVCPFTPEEPGKMRFVCIDSASRLQSHTRN